MTARWPKVLLGAAAFLALLHGGLALLGAERYVSFLCGARPGGPGVFLLGLAYVVTYFAEVVLAPILVLAGLLGLLWSRVLTRARPARADSGPVTAA